MVADTEVAQRAQLDTIHYARVWEDGDVLLAALKLRPGATCVSIASAGDNALALLLADPARVIAVDLNPAQLACVELRRAAYRCLTHGEFLELYGERTADAERRDALYRRVRAALRDDALRLFWDQRRHDVLAHGFGNIGKLERYMRLFRRNVLPLIHGRSRIAALLQPREPAARRSFYDTRWDGIRWRALFRIFFSRTVMSRSGRAAAFFDYAEGSVASHLLRRTEHAMVDLDPAENAYLRNILTETGGPVLPPALRAESFEIIRDRLDRLDLRQGTMEAVLDELAGRGLRVDGFNMSDMFEYMSEENHAALLDRILRCASPGARIAFWNMMVPRARPASHADRLQPLADEAAVLHARDRAFFYRAFHVEQVV